MVLVFLIALNIHCEVPGTQSQPTLRDPLDCSCPAPPSMGFSRREYWSGLPSPGDLPNPATEPGSPVFQADSLPSEEFFTELRSLLPRLGRPCFPLNSLKRELCCVPCCTPSIAERGRNTTYHLQIAAEWKNTMILS